MAFLVDIQPGHLGLERHELGAAAGEHDVRLGILEHLVHLARRHVVEHVGILTHQFLNTLLVF